MVSALIQFILGGYTTQRPEASPVDPHGVEGVGVENVEATPSVHEHLGETLVADDGIHDQGASPWPWHTTGVVGSGESDRRLRPSEEFWGRRLDRHNLSE